MESRQMIPQSAKSSPAICFDQPPNINEKARYVFENNPVIDIYNEAQLMQKLMPKVNLFIRRKVWDPSFLDDFQQDALEIILKKFRNGAIRKMDSLNAFADGVCRNLLLTHIRHQKRAQKYFVDREHTVDCTHDSEECNGLNKLMQCELYKTLKVALNNLNQERDRILLIDYYIYEKSVADLSDQFDISELHFHRIIYRARKRLLVEVKKLNYFDLPIKRTRRK